MPIDPSFSKMASVVRIANLSRPGYYMKMGKALRAIEACACVWVEEGVSVRDLTLAESIAARNRQAEDMARKREPLEFCELPWTRFELGDDRSAVNREMSLAFQAQQFFEEARA